MFSRLMTFENLHRAYLEARKCKRFRSSILKFSCDLEENLMSLRQELERQTYRHGSYREFIVADSKKRTIKAAPFRDRVVHQALCRVIEPIFEKTFIYDSYACRKSKGTHRAFRRMEKFVYSITRVARAGGQASLETHLRIFCLKCDISKFFDNIDHEKLLSVLAKKIHDERVFWLSREIIQSNLKGIPIGNLTSQLFANIYLNELDHFAKRVLREKHYLRYMDDFLILGTDKKRLHEDKKKIMEFLRDELRLELHPKKSEVFPVHSGLDFLGYVLRDGRRLLRKSTVKRLLKKKRRFLMLQKEGKLPEGFMEHARASWRGYARFASSYKLAQKIGLFEP